MTETPLQDLSRGADRLEATLYSAAGPDGLFALTRLWPGGLVREIAWRRTPGDDQVALRAFDVAGRLIGEARCGLAALKRKAGHA